jgi:hypothetical protein
LSGLIPASQQDDQLSSVLLEIHPISRAISDSQLRDTFTHWFDIPWVSCRQTFDPDLDSGSGLKVAKVV